MEHTDWIGRFPGLALLEPTVRGALRKRARVIMAPAGTVLFGPGKPAQNLLLLLDGVVRVSQTSESGREIVLYRVHAGESCVLTTACLLAHEDYAAEGMAETDVRAAALPRGVFDDLVAQSPTFRHFVFSSYARRISDLFLTIDEIAFQRVDLRLAQKLLELADTEGAVLTTHQQLASELGTAREVVSRQLSEFHRRGWIAQTRGCVQITNFVALQDRAADRPSAAASTS
ncbi:MAG: Crp/Fnr family transcriptional regulator [Pseudomonadota bacterium]